MQVGGRRERYAQHYIVMSVCPRVQIFVQTRKQNSYRSRSVLRERPRPTRNRVIILKRSYRRTHRRRRFINGRGGQVVQ